MGSNLRPEGGRHARTPACHRDSRARRNGERFACTARGEGAPGRAAGSACAQRASARRALAAIERGDETTNAERALGGVAWVGSGCDAFVAEPSNGHEPAIVASAGGSVGADASIAGVVANIGRAPEPAGGSFGLDRASAARIEPDGAPELDGDGACDAAEYEVAGFAAAGIQTDNHPSNDVAASGVASVNFTAVRLTPERVAAIGGSPVGDTTWFGCASVIGREQGERADAECSTGRGLDTSLIGSSIGGRSPRDCWWRIGHAGDAGNALRWRKRRERSGSDAWAPEPGREPG